MQLPVLIQGGVGVGVSNWRLARAVAQEGQMGVVSGTLLDIFFARRLQDGDSGGHLQRACHHFPVKELADQIYKEYFREGGKKDTEPYANVPMIGINPAKSSLSLIVLANFTDVYLAKEGHDGIVGINYLEKVQLPHLPLIDGAMLAGVNYLLMGAGIPKAIPGVLDALSENHPVSLKLDVHCDDTAENANHTFLNFDPREIFPDTPKLKRPKFIAIVSSRTLASNIAKKSSGKVDGFVIENHTAGGHNAPPRGPLVLCNDGEPVYGPRDEADLTEIKKLGLPFWLAGMYDNNEKLRQALDAGATGIQVGTHFAFCEESGIEESIKTNTLNKVLNGSVPVFTDPSASASGYPFKVADLEETLSDKTVYDNRNRICDLGYLRTAYVRNDPSIGFRCPGEPQADHKKRVARQMIPKIVNACASLFWQQLTSLKLAQTVTWNHRFSLQETILCR